MKRCFFCDLFCLLYLGFLGCCTILSKIVYFLSTVDLEERSIRSMEDNPSLFVLVFIEGKKGIVESLKPWSLVIWSLKTYSKILIVLD